MKIGRQFERIHAFVLRAIGTLPGDDGHVKSLPARLVRVVHQLIRGYADDDLAIHASSLTFVTLASLVPILAVGFALVKGFGLDADALASVSSLEWFQEMPEQWQAFVLKILEIVNTTNFAALGWIGLVFFLLTAVLLLANIEKSFNRVWGVDKNRSLLRQMANYTSVLVLVPVLIGLAGALKAQIVFSRRILGIDANVWAQNLAAFGLLWVTIAFLYIFVPNTRVRLRPALVSSLLTAALFLGWMRMFTVMQVGVTNYNRIYGAFAAVPVFMLWMYVTWVILLLGAEFAFALQNSDTFQLESAADSASTRARLLVALMILREAARAMNTGRGIFETAVFARRHKAPIRLINAVVAWLARRGYLAEVAGRDGGYVLMRAPDAIRLQEVAAALLREGGSHAELERAFTVDAALQETLEQLDRGIAQGLRERTLAELAAAPAAPSA